MVTLQPEQSKLRHTEALARLHPSEQWLADGEDATPIDDESLHGDVADGVPIEDDSTSPSPGTARGPKKVKKLTTKPRKNHGKKVRRQEGDWS